MNEENENDDQLLEHYLEVVRPTRQAEAEEY